MQYWLAVHRPTGQLNAFSFLFDERADLRAEADEIRRDIARTMKATKDREAAAAEAKAAAAAKVALDVAEAERAEAWEEEQRRKAAAGIATRESAKPVIDNFADEVAVYRAKAKKNKEVATFAVVVESSITQEERLATSL